MMALSSAVQNDNVWNSGKLSNVGFSAAQK